MRILESVIINNISLNFWEGFDIDIINKHSNSGSDGFMVVIIDSYSNLKLTLTRNSKISNLINDEKVEDIDDILKKIDNNYVMLYTSGGRPESIIDIVKEKIKQLNYITEESLFGFDYFVHTFSSQKTTSTPPWFL